MYVCVEREIENKWLVVRVRVRVNINKNRPIANIIEWFSPFNGENFKSEIHASV
jgi:hypothetical protein